MNLSEPVFKTNMKTIDARIEEALQAVNLKDNASVAAAANTILAEEEIPTGSVIVIDDPTYGMAGQVGKAKGVSNKGSGFVDVQFDDGRVLPIQASLLLSKA